MAITTIIGRRGFMELTSFTPAHPGGWTPFGAMGLWWRDPTVIGNTLETLVEFDVLAAGLAGVTINTASIEFDADSQGSQTLSAQSRLIEQTLEPFTTWYNLSRQPWFDDFYSSGQIPWPLGDVMSTITVQNTGTYTHNSNAAIVALVQDWVDGTTDWRNGIILDANFTALNWYLFFDEARLVLDYTAAGPGGHDQFYRRFNNNRK